MVTKLVSWFDINQASEETLQNKKHISIDNLCQYMFDDIEVYIFLIAKNLIQIKLNIIIVSRQTFQ